MAGLLNTAPGLMGGSGAAGIAAGMRNMYRTSHNQEEEGKQTTECSVNRCVANMAHGFHSVGPYSR